MIANINLGEIQLPKKLIVILVVLGFLTSGIAVVSGEKVQNFYNLETEKISSEKNENTITVTLFKHEFDGSSTPFEVEIELEEGKDIEDAIEEKCLELLENDALIKSLAEDDNITQELIMKIRSRGRGLHIRFNSRVQFFKLYKLFPFLPPYFRTFIIVPLIFCQYKNDKKARTEISQIKGNNSTTVVGPHRVMSIGFYGVSWWVGKVSLIGFVVRNGFIGISLLTRIKKL